MRYIDYGSMQREARRRVYDMQERARQAVGGYGEETPPPPAAPARPRAQQDSAGAQLDSERLLLLAVLALLVSEKADWRLIAAILYML